MTTITIDELLRSIIPGFRDLSECQMEVLVYVAEGLTDKEIADARQTKINSVKTQKRDIRKKLGILRQGRQVLRIAE